MLGVGIVELWYDIIPAHVINKKEDNVRRSSKHAKRPEKTNGGRQHCSN
jgi:hypothetical protein